MPRAPRLPSLHAEAGSRQAALAIALARVRASAAWTADVGEAELCMHHPPFGLRDQTARIKGILWNAIPRRNTSSDASNATVLRSSDGLLVSGRQLAGGSTATRLPENETEMLQACLQLAQLFKRITGRPSRIHHGTCAVVGSSGGLTGSWLALLLARVPIESSFMELAPSLKHCAFKGRCVCVLNL